MGPPRYTGPVRSLYQARDANMLVTIQCLCCPHTRQIHPQQIIAKQKRYMDIAFYQPTTLFLCRCKKKYAEVRPAAYRAPTPSDGGCI
jgi:hypothetical protein